MEASKKKNQGWVRKPCKKENMYCFDEWMDSLTHIKRNDRNRTSFQELYKKIRSIFFLLMFHFFFKQKDNIIIVKYGI
jgi:hypothetical protein